MGLGIVVALGPIYGGWVWSSGFKVCTVCTRNRAACLCVVRNLCVEYLDPWLMSVYWDLSLLCCTENCHGNVLNKEAGHIAKSTSVFCPLGAECVVVVKTVSSDEQGVVLCLCDVVESRGFLD